jgi:hypothetical protein
MNDNYQILYSDAVNILCFVCIQYMLLYIVMCLQLLSTFDNWFG